MRPKNYVAKDGLKLLLSSCLHLPSDERPVLLDLVYLVMGLEPSVSCMLSNMLSTELLHSTLTIVNLIKNILPRDRVQ